MQRLDILVGKDGQFNTIQQAVLYAQDQKAASTITLEEGRYFIEKAIEINADNNGLHIVAKEGATVTITGSLKLNNLVWQSCKHNTNIKVADVAKGIKADDLFFNSVPQIMARYPNYSPDVLPLGGVTDVDDIKQRSKAWQNPTTGRIRALHNAGWGGNDYIIEGVDDSDIGLKLSWVGDNNRGGMYMDSAVMAENIFEELDDVGEWFYDGENGKLYYYPEDEIDEDDVFELAVNSELFRVVGDSAASPVQDITFKSLQFCNTKKSIFTVAKQGKEYMPLMRGDWAVVRCGAVYSENAKGIKIEDCSFSNIGSNAVFMYGYNSENMIKGSHFIDVGSTAIQIVGSPSAVDEPSFWEHGHYPNLPVHLTGITNPNHVGPVSEDYPRDIDIKDCYFNNLGIYEKQSAGINMSVCSRVSIIGNTIHKSARSNINVNDGSFGGHEIAHNDIFDAQRETLDHGPFNSWGRDRFWSVPEYNAAGEHGEIIRNYTNDGKNFYDTALLDAYQTTCIHDNRFHHAKGAPHSWGIDLDDGSSNYEIYNNLCLGMGIKLREGFNRKVYNNIIIDGKMEIHVSYAMARDEIFSNIIVGASPWNFIAVDSERYKKTQYAVDKNWYYNFGSAIDFPEWFNQCDASQLTDIGAVVNIDPQFKNPHNNDYNVNNADVAHLVGFTNFSMDNFGNNMANSPIYAKTAADIAEEKPVTAEWKGAVISEITEAIISATASSGRQGVYLEDVPTNSIAYSIGFRKRDVVKEINKKPINGINEFLQALIGTENKTVDFKIHRQNLLAKHSLTML